MNKKLCALLERWLTIKIGVEVRCCLSFFLMLFYYCVFRLLSASTQADIWHITQMILIAYLFGWVQALLHADYDEMDRLGAKQWLVLAASGAVYGVTAQIGGWFGENRVAALLFPLYMILCGLSTVLIYYIKRTIDARLLNSDLEQFKSRRDD